MAVRVVQFQCQKEGTLFYYQHEEQQAPHLVTRCPLCGSKRVKATGRTFSPVDETAGVTDEQLTKINLKLAGTGYQIARGKEDEMEYLSPAGGWRIINEEGELIQTTDTFAQACKVFAWVGIKLS